MTVKPILSQGFWCKIFVQDLDHFEREEICTELAQNPLKIRDFFSWFRARFRARFRANFLQDSFPPPHSSSLPPSSMVLFIIIGAVLGGVKTIFLSPRSN
jgi:hypothetical protein